MKDWLFHHVGFPAEIYNRHPDTGDSRYQGAYLWIFGEFESNKQKAIEEFAKQGWSFLRVEPKRGQLVFVKEVK